MRVLARIGKVCHTLIMSNAATLGPAPTNRSDISFARECFEPGEPRVTYGVHGLCRHGALTEFSTRKEAEEFAARAGREAVEIVRPTQRRVRWN